MSRQHCEYSRADPEGVIRRMRVPHGYRPELNEIGIKYTATGSPNNLIARGKHTHEQRSQHRITLDRFRPSIKINKAKFALSDRLSNLYRPCIMGHRS